MIFIHPSAEVHSTTIGENTRIWQHVVVLKDAVIGENCNLNYNTFVENDVVLGNHVTVKSGVYLWDGIQVEDYVFIGPNATFVNNTTPRSQQYPDRHIGCYIKEGASIGANATILGGITIGRYAMIGAGSVLTKSTGDFELWYGNPASHKGYVTKQGTTLDLNLMDTNSTKYNFVNNELLPIK
ncbi:MAG: acetyltransferase [Cytophagaceae bacterium]|jgi:acetyltransferase-like isoleucine patch superfamily enzyme|nr:acetyltransferase [Cytophagaceae bacterium]